jgi:putative transposon-encoded protein
LPSSAAGSVSALIDYVEMSIYHLKIGVTIGGSANVGVPFKNYVGSGGITISGEGLLGESSFYSYVGSGVVVLSGTSEIEGGGASSSGYFEDLTTSVKYDVTYSGFDVFFNEVEAPAHVVNLPDVVNLCGCDPVNPIVNLKHNLLHGESKLEMFVKRNNFTLPADIELIYNSTTDSWRHNFHYISMDGIEHFDVLFEWSCVPEIGSNELGYDAWKFSILVHYKDTEVDKDTRVILVFPKGHFCSRGQRLDASFEINTQSKITTVASSSASFVVDTIINDAVGLFDGNHWKEHPNLEVDIEEEVETSTTFIDLDFKKILPKEDFQTGIVSVAAYERFVTAPASALVDTYND